MNILYLTALPGTVNMAVGWQEWFGNYCAFNQKNMTQEAYAYLPTSFAGVRPALLPIRLESFLSEVFIYALPGRLRYGSYVSENIDFFCGVCNTHAIIQAYGQSLFKEILRLVSARF